MTASTKSLKPLDLRYFPCLRVCSRGGGSLDEVPKSARLQYRLYCLCQRALPRVSRSEGDDGGRGGLEDPVGGVEAGQKVGQLRRYIRA